MRQFLRRIITWLKVLYIEIMLRLKGLRPPRRDLQLDRWERRRAMRRRGLVSQMYIRRALMERKYATRRQRQKLAKMKLDPPEPRGLRNPKKARRRLKIWYQKLMLAGAQRRSRPPTDHPPDLVPGGTHEVRA
jgi:hypothetical protein